MKILRKIHEPVKKKNAGNKNKQGDTESITRVKYSKNPSDGDGMVMFKEFKTKKYQNKLQQLLWKELRKEEDKGKDTGKGSRGP
jgi:hypothetical protein